MRIASASAFLNVLGCLGGLGLSSVFLHRILPPADLPEVTAKLEYFTRHKDEFDTLFIGSSRIYHGISPAVFDAATKGSPGASRSFNFGIDDMKPPESLYVLETLLDRKPAKLKWVFLELARLEIDPHGSNKETIRDVYWHDFRWTRRLIRAIRSRDEKKLYKGDPVTIIFTHLRLFAENYSNLGRGSQLLESLLQGRRDIDWDCLGPAWDGFVPREPRRWKDADFKKTVAAATSGKKASPSLRDPYLCGFLSGICQRGAKQGAATIFVIPPTFLPIPLPPPGAALLAFNDPRTYPSLYRTERRTDWEHLDGLGAEDFTRLLAGAFLRAERAE